MIETPRTRQAAAVAQSPDRHLTEGERLEVARLLSRWMARARVALSAYNDATTRTLAAERRLGVPAVILTAIVATGVFATVQEDPAVGWRVATGIVAVAAAVLTALQTFLRQAERAEQYREAARSYGRIRRRIERAQLFPPMTVQEADVLITEVSDALAEAASGKPNLPQRIWDRAEFKVKRTTDARGIRAFAIKLRESLDFGVGERSSNVLPEDHKRYFRDLEDAILVELSAVRPSSEGGARPESVATARQRMREAAAGLRDRRAPLEVRHDAAGGYIIVDGNSTFAVAEREGWETVPVRLTREAG